MIKDMIRPMIRSMVRPMIAAITRYFSTLDPLLNSHYVIANTLVFASGDTFEFEFLAPTGLVSVGEYLCDGDGSNTDRAFCLMLSGGAFLVNTANISSMFLDGNSVALNSLYPLDGELHNLKLVFSAPAKVKHLASRFNLTSFYSGILTNAKATISGITTTFALDNGPGDDIESSKEGGNSITRVNVPDANVELFQFAETRWDNISPAPQELPAIIEIA